MPSYRRGQASHKAYWLKRDVRGLSQGRRCSGHFYGSSRQVEGKRGSLARGPASVALCCWWLVETQPQVGGSISAPFRF